MSFVKNWKAALLWSLLLYFLIGLASVLVSYWYLALSPIFIALCAWLYFRKNRATLQEGLRLGVFFAFFAIILDMLFALPLLYTSADDFVLFLAFYFGWPFWVCLAEILIFSSLMGYVMRGN